MGYVSLLVRFPWLNRVRATSSIGACVFGFLVDVATLLVVLRRAGSTLALPASPGALLGSAAIALIVAALLLILLLRTLSSPIWYLLLDLAGGSIQAALSLLRLVPPREPAPQEIAKELNSFPIDWELGLTFDRADAL